MSGSESSLTDAEFEAALERLLARGERAGIAFDRSWTFRTGDGSGLEVEVTRLAPSEE